MKEKGLLRLPRPQMLQYEFYSSGLTHKADYLHYALALTGSSNLYDAVVVWG